MSFPGGFPPNQVQPPQGAGAEKKAKGDIFGQVLFRLVVAGLVVMLFWVVFQEGGLFDRVFWMVSGRHLRSRPVEALGRLLLFIAFLGFIWDLLKRRD